MKLELSRKTQVIKIKKIIRYIDNTKYMHGPERLEKIKHIIESFSQEYHIDDDLYDAVALSYNTTVQMLLSMDKSIRFNLN